MISLDDFAASDRGDSRCLTCNLPEEALTVVLENENRPTTNRIARKTVVAWAKSQGYALSVDSIYKHIALGH